MRWASCGRRWRHGNEPEGWHAHGVQLATTHRGRAWRGRAQWRSGAVNHDDDRVGRDYRAASAALDERPAPATRAAILAAAARGQRDRAEPFQRPGARCSAGRWQPLLPCCFPHSRRCLPCAPNARCQVSRRPLWMSRRRRPLRGSFRLRFPVPRQHPAAADAPRVLPRSRRPDTRPPLHSPRRSRLRRRSPSARHRPRSPQKCRRPRSAAGDSRGARDAVAPEGRSRAKEESVASRPRRLRCPRNRPRPERSRRGQRTVPPRPRRRR